jgi:hypothetical protein
MQLARMAATQFQHFTVELQALVDEVNARQKQSPPLQG